MALKINGLKGSLHNRKAIDGHRSIGLVLRVRRSLRKQWRNTDDTP
jgi:hypothetical protein